ncbi:2-hydroxyacid dehydrogenase [Rhizobacter sp. AJA081-3]|uniref:2-hydroxyacid dehydrogenase n=1 Tax=Rhizobacter sp. AJA081-3 TaxID=2753607 RepID=UPI001AE086CF|nr:2-hydroxyacid dehydrogenase [Rhizobacter sp. AJA081-3]QTN24380.1 2-hydroxyacid dehydrogenase [Rhizobacter sp. AJA081-3]
MKHRILQAGRLLPSLEARLTAEFDTHLLASEADPQAYLAAHGGEFEGFVTSAGVGISAATMDRMPKLRVVSSFGVGLDKLDLAAAQSRGIAVGYTPDVLNDCVADLAMVLMLDVARRVSEADRYVRRGGWTTPGVASFPLARKVSGAKLGIVGLGRIGQTIAKRAGGFEMDIRYHSRRPVEGAPWRHEPSLIELARWCDFLVVITAGGAGTKHLINAEVLDALGPRGFIVNVARGSVIDEAALVRALVDKRIAGAGLDVFENEPQVPSELFTLDNVVLLPHIASGTQETRQAMADRTFDNLQGFLRDGRMVSPAPLPN